MSRDGSIERLSAGIDGELTPQEAERLAEEIGGDPGLAALDRALRAADGVFRAEAKAVAPASLAAAASIRTAFAARRNAARRRERLRAALPIAASLLIAVGGAVWLDRRADERAADRRVETARLIETAVQNALETAESGNQVVFGSNGLNGHVTPVRTYRSTTNHWCREFEERVETGGVTVTRTGIACRDENGNWRRIETRYPGPAPLPQSDPI